MGAPWHRAPSSTTLREAAIQEDPKVQLICRAALDRKADDVVIMDMTQRSSFCDYFVVMSAPSTVRVRAIVDHIEETMKREGMPALHKEGTQEAVWVLMDFGNVIAHVFYHEKRAFYDLEKLWGDAPRRHCIH
jgi:ribosome-associated protein